MKNYFETYLIHHSDLPLEVDGIDLKGSCEAVAFETLDEAIAFADENDCNLICEMGGSWDEYKKCEFCGDWGLIYEIDQNNGICERCSLALYSRGERW